MPRYLHIPHTPDTARCARNLVRDTKEYDVTKTAGYREAMDDVKHGRVTHYDSLKDFYKEMGL